MLTLCLTLAAALLVALFLLYLEQAAHTDLVDLLRTERADHDATRALLAEVAPRRARPRIEGRLQVGPDVLGSVVHEVARG